MENYLSDIIKEEYQEWVPGHLIFLSAHTGSGKTFFILNELVRFAALNGKKILYLVNRSILQEQIQEKINTEVKSQLRCNKDIMSENLGNVIEVKLYQTIENECKRNPDYKSQEEYDYIIADECLDIKYLSVGIAFAAIGIGAGFYQYCRKDILS